MLNRRWLVMVVLGMALPLWAGEVIFVPTKIDGPVHDPANHSYWFGPFCECASVLDFDGDGDLDIAAGRNWYEAPNWIKHTDFRDGAETNGPETDNNSEFAMDVNFDGRMDIVSSGWMFTKGAFWYENPGKTGEVWKSRRIHHAINMEGVIHGDIDGDGDDDILCNHWALVKGQGMTWLEHIDKEPWFVEHVVGTEGDVHGNGLGDINGDGRVDIVTQMGWYEQPKRATDKPWTFHADYKFPSENGRGGPASHPILVHDVDGDGVNDIIIGASHAYGLAWLQQKVDGSGRRTFTTHWIETEYSQFHTLELGDLNGDGKPDMVTGKRLFAHHGADIGAFDPLYAFWYDIQGGQFERHILSFNHLPCYPEEGGINPPPNYVVSVGMKLNIADMNNDGRNDIVIAGKGGLYVFYNEGAPPTPRHKHKLAREEVYPTWRQWPQYEVLFNSKDLAGWKVPEGDERHVRVVDGVIDYDGKSEAKGDMILWTTESFEDFSLHVEWRSDPDRSVSLATRGRAETIASGAYSAILVRGVPRKPGELRAPMGPQEKGMALFELTTITPAGQWNSYDLTVMGDRATMMVNGKVTHESGQIAKLAESGPIGLLYDGRFDRWPDESRPSSGAVQFRNVLIRKLPAKAGQGRSVPVRASRSTGILPVSSMGVPPMVPDHGQDARATHGRDAHATDTPDGVVTDADGFVTLFNGKDLEGWIAGPSNSWMVQDGTLTVRRSMDGQEHNFDYLWARETYGDFTLDLEFKVIEGTNSGIFFRTSDLKDPVYTGIEVQVANSYGREKISRTGTAGAVYDCQEPSKNAIKPPGEWNRCVLTCRGSRVEVVLNGEQVIDMDLDRWTTAKLNPDNTSNKFPRAIKDFARTGYIGLQDHGRPVWYRNIRIKRL